MYRTPHLRRSLVDDAEHTLADLNQPFVPTPAERARVDAWLAL